MKTSTDDLCDCVGRQRGEDSASQISQKQCHNSNEENNTSDIKPTGEASEKIASKSFLNSKTQVECHPVIKNVTDSYVLGKKLGEGSFAEVFKATPKDLSTPLPSKHRTRLDYLMNVLQMDSSSPRS